MSGEYKNDKLVKIILENHFEEFKEKHWNRVRREMREHIENTVERALNCGNIDKNNKWLKKYHIYHIII